MENTIKRQILYLCSWNFQTTRLLISIALLFGVCGYMWFEAQNECRLVGETLGLRPHTTEPFWTSLHKRRSLWMQNLGCYKYSDQDPALKDGDVFDMTHYASAGLCQELCMEQNKKFSFLFGIKDQNCFCFKYDILPLLNSCNSRCKGTCSSGNGSNCSKYRTYLSVGGQRNDRFPAAYPGCIVIQCIDYISYKVRRCESNFTTACEIQDSINQVYHSKPVNFVLKYKEVQNPSNYFGKDVESFFLNTCKSRLISKQRVWIAFSRENYTRLDKGEMLSDVDKRNTMACQLCKDGCRFDDCNLEVDEAVCSKTIVTKETSTKTALKMTVTRHSFSNTGGISKTPNETRETKGRETTEEVSGLPHNYSDQTLSYILATTTSTNNVTTSLVCLGLTVFCIRRKRTSAKTERPERHKAPSTGQIKPINTNDSKMDTVAKLKTSANEKADNSRFEKYVYDMADNSKLKEESPYSEGGEGHYDHLRDTTSRRQIEEDTYNHIAPAGYATISEYDEMRKKEGDQYRQSQFPTDSHAHAYSSVTLELYDKKCKYSKPQKRLE